MFRMSIPRPIALEMIRTSLNNALDYFIVQLRFALCKHGFQEAAAGPLVGMPQMPQKPCAANDLWRTKCSSVALLPLYIKLLATFCQFSSLFATFLTDAVPGISALTSLNVTSIRTAWGSCNAESMALNCFTKQASLSIYFYTSSHIA